MGARGVSARYTNELMVTRSAELRLAQEQISARMFDLLGLSVDSRRSG
jgi:hypothetical protein